MNGNRLRYAVALSCCFLASAAGASRAKAAPSVEQALSFKPIQPNIAYSQPTKAEIAQCTIRAEKQNNATPLKMNFRKRKMKRIPR